MSGNNMKVCLADRLAEAMTAYEVLNLPMSEAIDWYIKEGLYDNRSDALWGHRNNKDIYRKFYVLGFSIETMKELFLGDEK